MEQIVIGLLEPPFSRVVLAELLHLQEEGFVRVGDQLVVTKASDGQVTMREVRTPGGETSPAYEALAVGFMGWLTTEERATLAGELPPSTQAVLVLLEHEPASGLTEAVRKAGGILVIGEKVPTDILQWVGAELARAQQAHLAERPPRSEGDSTAKGTPRLLSR